MIKFLTKLYNRLRCFFRGHSHPGFICFYCGARSPLEFVRDNHGNVLKDHTGQPMMKWIGRGW